MNIPEWDQLPTWAQVEIEELEQDLFDGYISFSQFNREVECIEDEVYGYLYDDDVYRHP